MTAGICAFPYATQFTIHEDIGRGIDNGNHQTGEGVSGGYERSCISTILLKIESSHTGASTKDPVDFRDRILADALRGNAALGELTQGRPDPPGIHNRCRRRRRLQQGSPTDAGCTFLIQRRMLRQPTEQSVEVAKAVAVRRLRGGVRIHEVEPEARSCRGRRRWPLMNIGRP